MLARWLLAFLRKEFVLSRGPVVWFHPVTVVMYPRVKNQCTREKDLANDLR